MNSFGKNLKLTTFGESHGPAMGGIIDGFPPGFKIDFDLLYEEIAKRKPGSSPLVTARKEDDRPEFLSGISEDGLTLGTPIGFIVRNSDHHSRDYDDIKDKYRPNHADFTYMARYGLRDHRGGGRASARETVSWVVAGALANQWLLSKNIEISAVLSAVGNIDYKEDLTQNLIKHPFDRNSFEVPSEIKERFDKLIFEEKKAGNSIGGIVTCLITGLQAGIGNPVFEKLHANLAKAMMSINAAKAFEYGSGFDSPVLNGFESADLFSLSENDEVVTLTNYSGGIQGGITNGMPVFFSVYFKPTPTVLKELPTIDNNGVQTVIKPHGRHDPCVAVRAVPIVKAMASLVIVDAII